MRTPAAVTEAGKRLWQNPTAIILGPRGFETGQHQLVLDLRGQEG